MKTIVTRAFSVLGLASGLLHCSTNPDSETTTVLEDEASRSDGHDGQGHDNRCHVDADCDCGSCHAGHCKPKPGGHGHGHGHDDCGQAGTGGQAAGGSSGVGGSSGAGAGGSSGGGGGPVGCIGVAPNGDDAAALSANGAVPFRNVQPAIDFAAAHPDVASSVCVASGAACGATAEYPGPDAADLRMRDGIGVTGRYESSTWTRCTDSVTRLLPKTSLGVLFGAEIVDPTTLEDFEIVSSVGVDPVTIAAVTVDGGSANLVGISAPDREWPPEMTPITSVGVDALANSNVTITDSDLFAPPGLREADGVRGVSAHVVIQDSQVRARGPWQSSAVRLDTSPGSILARNVLSSVASGDTTGVFVAGLLVNTLVTSLLVEDNDVTVVGQHQDTRGIALMLGGSSSGGTVVARNRVSAQGAGDVRGIFSDGAGSPTLLENEVRYVAAGTGSAFGITCEVSGMTACGAVRGNIVHGITATPDCPGDCAYDVIGMRIGGITGTNTVVDSNRTEGGCTHDTSPRAVVGMEAGGIIRVENNVAIGSTCSTFAGTSVGLQLAGIFSVEDVNSNLADGGSSTGACTSSGFRPVTGSSVVGNNIFRPGLCGSAADVDLLSAGPATFTSNAFAPGGAGAVLARTRTGDLTTIDQINALPGASGNFLATCTLPLDASSPCVDAGNPAGAPDHDIDQEPRSPSTPDVGPDEWGDAAP